MLIGLLLSGWMAASGGGLAANAGPVLRSIGPTPTPTVWLDHGRGTPAAAESRRPRQAGSGDPEGGSVVTTALVARQGPARFSAGVAASVGRAGGRADPRTSRGPPAD